MARHGGSSFEAYGNVRFVAAATLGHAIGDAIQSHEDFDDCMVAGGWQIASDQSRSEQSNRSEHDGLSESYVNIPETSGYPQSIRGILSASNTCVNIVRVNPDFAAVQQYLGDLDTGKHTMLQLTVMRFATVSEVKAYASMIDQAHSCINIAIEQVEQVSPLLANILEKYREDSDARALAVLRQQQTWGDYALQQDRAIDALKMHLKESSL